MLAEPLAARQRVGVDRVPPKAAALEPPHSDQRLATSASIFQAPEVKLGFLPGMATFRLAKYVGLGIAKRLLLTCPEITADEACLLYTSPSPRDRG